MDALPGIRPLIQSWGTIEAWAVRFFIFLGVLTLFPWILLVLFDAGLYVWRYLILAPIAKFLYPGAYPSETSVVFGDEDEDEDEDSGAMTKVVNGGGLDGGLQAMRELPDGLDRVLKEKDA